MTHDSPDKIIVTLNGVTGPLFIGPPAKRDWRASILIDGRRYPTLLVPHQCRPVDEWLRIFLS